jgi:hypothetical protein
MPEFIYREAPGVLGKVVTSNRRSYRRKVAMNDQNAMAYRACAPGY